MLNIAKETNGAALTLGLEGRLDTTTAPDLENVVKTELSGISELNVDMTSLEYISSAGLRVLLSAQKVMNKQGTMTIKNASEDVKEIFDVTGFSDILNIE